MIFKLKILGGLLIAAGFIFAIGTAGAADLHELTIDQIWTRVCISFALLGVGYALTKLPTIKKGM